MKDIVSSFQHPLVSVIIPAYNAEAFIEKTLDSVLNQTYQNLEIIVVDDGSQDRSAEIVRAIAQREPRVTLLQQPNSGVAAARNLPIQASCGELIAPIDADDLWHPENLEKQVQRILQSDSTVGLSYAWSVDIDEDDLATGECRASSIKGNVYKTLICHNFLGNSSASVIRRSCLEEVGGYDCHLKAHNAQGCEDWDLYLRIAERYQFCVVPEFLIGYRKIQMSMSRDYSQMARSHALMLQSVKQKHPEIPAPLYRLSSSSFYMYLARQSHQGGNYRGTLFWLQKALQADWITPPLRYRLYSLSIQSILGLTAQPLLSPLHSPVLKKQSVRSSTFWSSSNPTELALVNLKQRQGSLRFKLLVGNFLHRSLQVV